MIARGASQLAVPALASLGAAAIHAMAAGAHTDPVALARIFIATALLQAAVAVAGLLWPGRAAALALAGVNAAAAAGWLLTRLTGLGAIPGLEAAERAGVADSVAAGLAAIAVIGSLLALFGLVPHDAHRSAVTSAMVVTALVAPAMFEITNHDASHSHVESAAAPDGAAAAPVDDGHDHTHATVPEAADTAAVATPPTTEHTHVHPTESAPTTSEAPAPEWPRPWDPTEPIDFSGVSGVSAEQQARAEQLVADTMRELPAFADVGSVAALGYRSIGDARTGHEHFINLALLGDDKVLDPTAPESLVYRVDDAADPSARTLVSAMFLAQATGVDDPELADYAGPLMQWHNHTNLCWGRNPAGEFVVLGVTDNSGGVCPEGQVNTGGQFPMVHVWIAPHECGPFAALEGHGAGQVGELSAGERVDLCATDHDHSHGAADASATVPYDPALPIDLGGTPGVTPEQQAFAENLVADTVRNLPQWADYRTAEAAGFHSIGDGSTGHEHFIQWDWIDDDVFLDPDRPESLVYEPQLDGSKRLVSAMFMLPTSTPLDDVPDWGGALMQWHVHGDLCFTADPVAPQVAGVKPIDQPCAPPLVALAQSPMIHVWIVPTPCGPFAALKGIGAGQVAAGEEALCDHAHGT